MSTNIHAAFDAWNAAIKRVQGPLAGLRLSSPPNWYARHPGRYVLALRQWPHLTDWSWVVEYEPFVSRNLVVKRPFLFAKWTTSDGGHWLVNLGWLGGVHGRWQRRDTFTVAADYLADAPVIRLGNGHTTGGLNGATAAEIERRQWDPRVRAATKTVPFAWSMATGEKIADDRITVAADPVRKRADAKATEQWIADIEAHNLRTDDDAITILMRDNFGFDEIMALSEADRRKAALGRILRNRISFPQLDPEGDPLHKGYRATPCSDKMLAVRSANEKLRRDREAAFRSASKSKPAA